MLSYLADYEAHFGPLRLFASQTFRIIMGSATALVIGFLIGPWLIRRFRELKFGHGYIDERTGALGATYFDKKHTPTMGGLIIFLSVFLSSVLWARPNVWVVVALFVYAALTIPGWRDDYLKVVHKNKDGIRAWEKIGWQSLATGVALGVLLWHPVSADKIRELWVPFFKEAVLTHMPWWLLLVLIYLWVVGFSNAINLTDGLDGLAIGCVIITTLVLGGVAYLAGHRELAEYLRISHVPGAGELAVLCSALVGGGLVFLWHNAAPAELYMGDVGALGLGGVLGAVACLMHQPFLLAVVGGVFLVEAVSVILQVAYFRRTGGRRLFLMTPIHHHFQKKGWPATKVVARFWILSFLCGLLGLLTLKLR